MRHLTLLLVLPVMVSACTPPDPPLLKVTSPQRSLVLDAAGSVTVTGTVAPNANGAAVTSVTVNKTRAAIGSDGSFTATIAIPPGGNLISTVATDEDGGVALDTRSVIAGERRDSGSTIPSAIAASLSPSVFGKIGDIAGRLIKSANLDTVIKPLNPVIAAGPPNSCNFAQAYVDHATITDATVKLVPVAGGVQLTATFGQPAIDGHVDYAVLCNAGSSAYTLRANSATVNAVLAFDAGAGGLQPRLVSPSFDLPGLKVTATGVPQAILNILPLEGVINFVAPTATRLFVDPMIKDALGDLEKPIQIPVLDKMVTVAGAPNAIAFSPAGASLMLDVSFQMAGGERSRGFTFTPNGTPSLVPHDGIGVGIADDLVNEAIAQLAATGALDLTLPFDGGEFDTVKLSPTLPPVINADGADGRLKLLLPDMAITFLASNRPVASAAVNAQIAVAIRPAAGGGSVAIDLGQASIAIDATDDVSGLAMQPGSNFAAAIDFGTKNQKSSIQLAIGAIPLPKLGEITVSDASITADSGYLKATATLK